MSIFTFGQTSSRSLEGRCTGTKACPSEGPHLTGCVRLRADLQKWKARDRQRAQERRR